MCSYRGLHQQMHVQICKLFELTDGEVTQDTLVIPLEKLNKNIK